MHIYTYIHVHTHTHIHIYTHTHTKCTYERTQARLERRRGSERASRCRRSEALHIDLFMSLKTHHITSYSAGFPSHARVPAQNFSNFEPIYVIPCTCSFQIALLFWYFNLRGLLKVLHSQCSRCTMSLVSQTGWWRVLVWSHNAW